MKEQTAEWINRLGRFCGKRDVPELTPDQLYRKYQIRQADVLVLFGGSILCGGDVLADAMKQDAAMQRRMDAGLRKQNADARIINFAAYQAEVTVRNGEPEYEKEIWGMWDMDRYITLLMGEIPR